MEKLFEKDKASVYGYLSGLSLAVVVVVMVAVTILRFSGLPVKVMPIFYLPWPLFFTSMAFGILAITSYWRMDIFTFIALAGIEILLIVAFNFFYSFFQTALIQPDVTPTMTSVVMDGRWKRDYNLGYGIVVVETVCLSNGLLVDVYNGTKIYEQEGTSQQKRRVGIEALQPGQVVDIEFQDLLTDPELEDLIFSKYDRRGFDTTFLIGAIEIAIRRGKYGPVDSHVGNSLCEILPEQ